MYLRDKTAKRQKNNNNPTETRVVPENANDAVNSADLAVELGARNPHTVPELSPNCSDKGICFYLMLGFSEPVIDAGLSKAGALIVLRPHT